MYMCMCVCVGIHYVGSIGAVLAALILAVLVIALICKVHNRKRGIYSLEAKRNMTAYRETKEIL